MYLIIEGLFIEHMIPFWCNTLIIKRTLLILFLCKKPLLSLEVPTDLVAKINKITGMVSLIILYLCGWTPNPAELPVLQI